MENKPEVNLGFASNRVPEGTHMCLVFTSEEERVDSLLKYLLSGLQAGERSCCFSEKITEEDLRAFFTQNNINYDERKGNKAINLSSPHEVYFEGGVFDPDRMLKTLTNFYKESKALGYKAARVIGEMSPEIETVLGGERLLEYESRVSILLRKYPVTSVCQYDANCFDGATIMEVLKVHPQMIINGAVVKNPFFIDPEEYLRKLKN